MKTSVVYLNVRPSVLTSEEIKQTPAAAEQLQAAPAFHSRPCSQVHKLTTAQLFTESETNRRHFYFTVETNVK